MDLMSIGEFAGRSRLSPKALRLYDELGLLPPARVDDSSGYRLYDPAQLDQARLIAALRQLQLPLSEIKALLQLEPTAAAQRLRDYWAGVEVEHSARRELAGYLVDQLSGERSVMYEVTTRDIPTRSLLCLKRNTPGEEAAWALGKEFIAVLRRHELPRVEGPAGAAFCIYWGEVTDDSDGPLEWCRPVPDDRAQELAAEVGELQLRTEPAHREASVYLGIGGQIAPTRSRLVSESLRAWAEAHAVRPSDLGVRITYRWEPPRSDATGPDCEFAVPFGQLRGRALGGAPCGVARATRFPSRAGSGAPSHPSKTCTARQSQLEWRGLSCYA